MRTYKIRVRGTDHYHAKPLFKSGALRIGVPVNLVAEQNIKFSNKT